MELAAIEKALENPDFQYRLKAIAALKAHPAEVAVPLLLQTVNDPEFLVRTFVARGLGSQQTAESFAALLEMTKLDNTPSVRAEAANSLSLFGRVSASHLVQAFIQDDHWLIRRSILAALADMNCFAELYEVCVQALTGEDATVQETAVDALGMLAGSHHHTAALAQLLPLSQSPAQGIRQHVAYALHHFDDPEARAARAQLRQDPDHRVVGAALEGMTGVEE
jgi:HEAT repeat protein